MSTGLICALVTLQMPMGWFQKHLHIKTTSVFLILFPSWFPSPAPSLSHALTHSAWILAGTASAVKAAAVGIPPSPAHLEVCKWALQTDTVFCSLFDKSLLWPLSFHRTHKSPQPMEAGYQIQIPYMWKCKDPCIQSGPPPFRFICESYIKLPREQARIFSYWCLPANDFSPSVINHVSIF